MPDNPSSNPRLTPAALAEEIEKRVRADLDAIRDPEIRREAEERLAQVTGQLRQASAEGPVIEKGALGFFSDLSRRRREGERTRRRKRRRFGFHVDEFGFDRVYWRRVEPVFGYLYENYWRVETSGLEHIPIEGRALLVANHSGILPWDALMLREAVEREHPAQRHVRPLVEDFTAAMPFLGSFLRKVGIARSDRLNAQRLLENEKLVAVFPEGIQGVSKPYRHRYQLQRFGRGGTIKLAIQAKAPLIPTAIVGGEEIYPVLGHAEWLGRVLGLPTFPVTPTFPWLGPAGLIPLPSKWYIRFGEPMELPRLARGVLDDEIRINRMNEELRRRVQRLIHDVLRERNSAWLG